MNLIKELLENSEWGDGLKPKYSAEMMGERIQAMGYEEFKMFCNDMVVAANTYDIMHMDEAGRKSTINRKSVTKKTV